MMSNRLTPEQFKAALPKQMQKRVNTEVMDSINDILTNSEIAEHLRENMLGFSSVLKEGRYKMESYINAVKYVSYKMMGDVNHVAYAKTFPDKIARWDVLQVSPEDRAKYVNIFNKTKLVMGVYDLSLTPTHILNADVFQKAINVQASIMNDLDVSPKVRSDAANSLLTHLKRPEAQKVELDVGVKDSSAISELKDITMRLAKQQQEMIGSGVYTSKDIAHQRIIEGEVTDVE